MLDFRKIGESFEVYFGKGFKVYTHSSTLFVIFEENVRCLLWLHQNSEQSLLELRGARTMLDFEFCIRVQR